MTDENNPWIQVPPAVRTVLAGPRNMPVRISLPWVSLRRNEPDIICLEGYYSLKFHYGLRGIFHSRAWDSQEEAEKMWLSQRHWRPNIPQLGYYHGCICVPQVYWKEFQDVPLHDLFFFSAFNGFYYLGKQTTPYPPNSLEAAMFDVENPQKILKFTWHPGS